MMFAKAAIIGVGQIGGSLGWGLKKRGLAGEVVGAGRTIRNLRTAVSLGLVDSFTETPQEAVRGADLIVLATPVHTIPILFGSLAGHIMEGAVITDVGSVKGAIVRSARLLGPLRSSFVGSHPMAGSEKSGASSATADLFTGKVVILTPTKSTHKRSMKSIKGMWKSLGARVVVMNPELHDRTMAFVSHVPHLLSYAFTESVDHQQRRGEDFLPYTGGSFSDFTRISGSSPEMWEGIFRMNWKEIDRASHLVRESLDDLISAIRNGNRRGIIRILSRAQRLASRAR